MTTTILPIFQRVLPYAVIVVGLVSSLFWMMFLGWLGQTLIASATGLVLAHG